MVALAAWTLGLYFVRLLRPNRVGRAWVFRKWAQGVARIAGMKIRAEGRPPSRPFLLVSNHLSYLDIVVLSALVDCIFVAKRDVRNWPALGRMVAGMDTIFVDRQKRRDILRVNHAIERALSAGEGVVLFAEGTSTSGSRVLPLKPSLLNPAARQDLPVSYASITYGNPAVCWYGDMTFAGHFIDLLKTARLEATLVFGEEPVRETDRKRLAQQLHQRIAERFTPIAGAQ